LLTQQDGRPATDLHVDPLPGSQEVREAGDPELWLVEVSEPARGAVYGYEAGAAGKDTVDKVNPSVVTGRAAVEGKFVVTSLPTTIPIDVLLRLAGVVVLQRKPLYVKLIPFLSVDTPPGITNPVLERAADSWNSVRTRSAGVLRASPE
jgi:hypothetical protein